MRRVSGWRACNCPRESSDRKISPSSSRKNSDRVSGEDRLPPSWGSRLCTIQKKPRAMAQLVPGGTGEQGQRLAATVRAEELGRPVKDHRVVGAGPEPVPCERNDPVVERIPDGLRQKPRKPVRGRIQRLQRDGARMRGTRRRPVRRADRFRASPRRYPTAHGTAWAASLSRHAPTATTAFCNTSMKVSNCRLAFRSGRIA